MHRITYLVNGDTTTNTIHCRITEDLKTLYKVLINDELERNIKKNKIVEMVQVDFS
jgi:hypothetical protein